MKLIEIAIFSENVVNMSSFYKKLLGTKPVAESEGMAIFMNGETKIFIHRIYQAEEGELPPENHIAFEVDNVDNSCSKLAEEGVKIEVAPKDYYWGRSAYLRNPDGQLIELIQKATVNQSAD